MIRAQRRQDSLAQNIANVNTNGFRADNYHSDGFWQAMQESIGGMGPMITSPLLAAEFGETTGMVGTGVHPDRIVIDFSQGTLRETKNPLDMAIAGDGFFVIQDDAGETYTRDGSFRLNDQGQLITGDNRPVLGENGPITLGPGPVTVNPNGDVLQDGNVVGRLRVVTFETPEDLRKRNDGLLVAQDGVTPTASTNFKVEQGVIEGSNVDVAQTMTDMMAVMRSYESAQRTIKMAYELAQKSASEVGKV
jgi:flagellar basal-body rod protein FlgG